MRSCTSGVSTSTAGRDQAPDKRKRNLGRLVEGDLSRGKIFSYLNQTSSAPPSTLGAFADSVLSQSSRSPKMQAAFEPFKPQNFGSTMPAVFNTARKTSAPVGFEEFKGGEPQFNPFKSAQKQIPLKAYGGDSPVRPRTGSMKSAE